MTWQILAGTLVVLTYGGATAVAATRLSDATMDRMTAGEAIPAPLPPVACPSCTVAYSSSMSNNGVTVSMSGSQTPGSGGGGGGSGGSGSGGGGSGNGGGSGIPGGVTTTVAVPPGLAATIAQASTPTLVSP